MKAAVRSGEFNNTPLLPALQDDRNDRNRGIPLGENPQSGI